jgi:hypothetical protein
MVRATLRDSLYPYVSVRIEILVRKIVQQMFWVNKCYLLVMVI